MNDVLIIFNFVTESSTASTTTTPTTTSTTTPSKLYRLSVQ